MFAIWWVTMPSLETTSNLILPCRKLMWVWVIYYVECLKFAPFLKSFEKYVLYLLMAIMYLSFTSQFIVDPKVEGSCFISVLPKFNVHTYLLIILFKYRFKSCKPCLGQNTHSQKMLLLWSTDHTLSRKVWWLLIKPIG